MASPVFPLASRPPDNLDALPLSEELVSGLEHLIPERCPAIDMSDRAIWIYSGKRELVKALRAAWERRKKRALK